MYEEIAKQALNDLTNNGVPLEGDRYYDAKGYAEEALVTLQSMSTYNPANDAPVLARLAAIEFVKTRLMGQTPTQSGSFLTMAQKWTQQAPIHRHNAKYGSTSS